MNNIEKAIEIVNKYYYRPINCKIYKNQVELLKAESRDNGYPYKYLVKYYREYILANKTEYIEDVYNNDPKATDTIAAICGDPIKINSYFYSMDTDDWIITLLHEMAHNYYFEKSNGETYGGEHECDLYAIRWAKKIKKIQRKLQEEK